MAPAAGAQVGTPILELQAGSYGAQRSETWGRGAREGSVQSLPHPLSSPELAPEIREIKKKAVKKKRKNRKKFFFETHTIPILVIEFKRVAVVLL